MNKIEEFKKLLTLTLSDLEKCGLKYDYDFLNNIKVDEDWNNYYNEPNEYYICSIINNYEIHVFYKNNKFAYDIGYTIHYPQTYNEPVTDDYLQKEYELTSLFDTLIKFISLETIMNYKELKMEQYD